MEEMTPEAHTLKVGPDGREHLQCRGRQPSGTQGSTMICIDLTQQNANHPDKRRRHQGRAICEVAGRRLEAQGPAPIYKLVTLLWLHGHGGVGFEVGDDQSPFGNPGGLAMRGKVRNWARLVNGKPRFDKDAPPETEFSPHERELIAQAAGSAADDSPQPDNGRTGASRPSDGPTHPREGDESSTGVVGARTSEAA